MVILFFGDIFAKIGRRVVQKVLPELKKKYSPDFVLGNVENLAGGRGINDKSLTALLEWGFDGFTSGNHIWDNKEVLRIFGEEKRVIRPANYPDTPFEKAPGYGHTVLEKNGKELWVINIMGRVFMDSLNCPFLTIDHLLKENRKNLPIFVDFHAETTSEKAAMGWFLDGRVSAVVGTHTHVQTADERILPKGTAFITDVGMTGSFDSCIGMDRHAVLKKFVTKRPFPYQPSVENPGVAAVVIKVGDDHNARSIERIRFEVPLEHSSENNE